MKLDELPDFIAAAPWQFARTMPDTPHEYTTRAKCRARGLEADFEAAVMLIREQGYEAEFGGRTYTYLDAGDGLTYWTMGDPLAATIILNRAVLPSSP